jgi:hypothetical protein
MPSRLLAFAGSLLLSGCAYDAGYYDSNYAREPGSVAGYYSPIDDSEPYRPASPVYGSNYGWSARFVGWRHAYWKDGDRRNGNWHHANGQHGGWNNGGRNPKPWVYRMPLEPDGSGAPTFLPNGCGANGQPPC